MCTFKTVVCKNPRKNGLRSVSIRICWRRQYAFVKTEYYVTDKQLTTGLQIKDPFLNREIANRIARYEELKVLKLKQYINQYTAKELAAYFERSDGQGDAIDFFEFSEAHKSRASEGTKRIDAIFLSNLKKFVKADNLPVSTITSSFLRDYEEFILKDCSLSTCAIYMGRFHAMFNRMRDQYNDEDKGDILIPHNPFKKYKAPKPPLTKKRALSVEIIRQIWNLKLDVASEEFARDVFMLSFCLAGMNTVDMYHLKEYKDGRISYCRQKTKSRRGDEALMSLEVPKEVIPLFEKYKGRNTVFNFSERFSTQYGLNENVNRALKFVGAKVGVNDLEHGSARHSFATIARNDCGLSKWDVHEALNHVDQGTKIDDVYVKRDFSVVDRVVRLVLDVVQLGQ